MEARNALGEMVARDTDLYLEEILRRAIDLLEALLARIWHCLHRCDVVEVMAQICWRFLLCSKIVIVIVFRRFVL